MALLLNRALALRKDKTVHGSRHILQMKTTINEPALH